MRQSLLFMFFNEISYSIMWPGADLLGSVRLSYGCKVFENETRIFVQDDREFLGFYINLGNTFDFTFDRGSHGTLHKGQYILIYLPNTNCEYEVKRGRISEFGFHFTPEFLRTLIDQFPVLQEFLKNVERKQPCTLSVAPMQVTGGMLKAIKSILLFNRRWDEERNTYFLSRILDILKVCLEQISLINPGIHHRNNRAAQEVRKRLLDRLQDHHNLNLLADQAHIDQRTLTRVFNKMYGKTVARFLFDERMKKAMLLLRESTMNLEEIAHATGYKMHASFTKAFKRKFGYPPIHFRQTDFKGDSTYKEIY